ncbi:unnamed protein product [Owenia fusiformis]|uniref:G-protein coupled receptors family 1 profile domain-containing protein n=1 Tax=Owenia fusiformis TaxID=6347 RepID=A0A8S4PX56_OWEFU|nr:unnamed protein product [Owenia fusiformis]
MLFQNDADIGVVPIDHVYCPTWFHIVYYGVFMPFSYIGNFLTCVIVIRLMQFRHSIPDVLVGGLALNDVLTAVVVFTWSIIAEIRQEWIPWPHLCRYHAVAKAWYIYTTFAIIVLMSVERWLAIIKPFYHQVHMTTLKMKLTIGGLGLFCLLGSSISLVIYPVDLKPGWYCAMTAPYMVINHTRVEIPGAYPYPYTIGIAVMLTIGIAVLLVCNIHIIIVLRKKSFKRLGIANIQLENRFAKVMGIIAVIFVLTWVPSLVTKMLSLKYATSLPVAEFWSSRIVNMSVAVNPLVYGVMKSTYRRAYWYLIRMTVHFCSFRIIPAPDYGFDIFDTRQGKSIQSTQNYKVQKENTDLSSDEKRQHICGKTVGSESKACVLTCVNCENNSHSSFVSVNSNDNDQNLM